MSKMARVFYWTERYEPSSDGDYVFNPEFGQIVPYDEKLEGNLRFLLADKTEEQGNTLILPGRKQLGYMITDLASGGFSWVAAGSGSQAVDSVNDDRLGGYPGSTPAAFEYIASGVRKKLQSTTYGGDLTTADWVEETYTDGLGNVFREKCLATVTYGPSDPNGTPTGVPLRRYGFCALSPTPPTVTGYSGIMFNEMIDSVDQNLTDVNTVQVRFIIRI